MMNKVLGLLSDSFSAAYSVVGRPSIPREQLLRALLLRALFSFQRAVTTTLKSLLANRLLAACTQR